MNAKPVLNVLLRRESAGPRHPPVWVAIGIEEFVANQGTPHADDSGAVLDHLGVMLSMRDVFAAQNPDAAPCPTAPPDIVAAWLEAPRSEVRDIGSRLAVIRRAA